MQTARGERLILLLLAVCTGVLRAVAFFRYRFDSDESQHLHVTWGWTAGLLQYRDVFDNHAPLFHMLTAPLLALVGERPTVLFYMRLPMLVLWAVVLASTFVIARRLYDTRVAAWSTLLLAVLPVFFLRSLEYRTDNLWNALWMLAVVALMSKRFLAAGLLLGLATATSMKTPLLIVTLGIAYVILSRPSASLRAGFDGEGSPPRRLFPFASLRVRVTLMLLLGAILPPALLAWYFSH